MTKRKPKTASPVDDQASLYLDEKQATKGGQVHEQHPQHGASRVDGLTVLDAVAAYRMLDNPPQPSQALCDLLTLR